MEKPIFPAKTMRITQGYEEGTHKDSYAIDNADIDYRISNLYAPYTGIIKKIYPNDANEIWLESIEPVEYPDGTIDYLTMMFAHDNNIDDLFVGKKINQGEVFYQEGVKGNATGNHCHIECGKGKFTENGWHKNSAGYWSINNRKKPEECLWIDDSISIIDDYGYSFKKISTEVVEKEKQEEKKEQFIFIAPKKDLYGVYLEQNQKIIIELS
ncbi:MAG: hypothetical protein IJG68_03355 [Bacilli bacterium]|nr:hypothetical protein [Bacilli bacterium]